MAKLVIKTKEDKQEEEKLEQLLPTEEEIKVAELEIMILNIISEVL